MIKLSENNSIPVLETLASAFMDDPMYKLLLPEISTRKEKLKAWFDYARRLSLEYGCIFTTSLHYEGVAMWINSENSNKKLNENVRVALQNMKKQWGRKIVEFYFSTGDLVEPFRKQIQEPYWYLFVLGVHPEFQNQGFGTFLMNEMFQLTASDDRPYFLEVVTERTMNFYQKFGFKVMGKVLIPNTDINIWMMIKKRK